WRYYGNDDVAIPATAQPWIQDETTPTDNLLEQPNSPLLQDAYPQLLLSNIAFDGTGDLVVGIKDRFGDQSGYHAGGTDPTDQSQYDGNAAGDVLRLCAPGEGSWAVENNGQCGDATGAGVDNGRGHGGGEFYPGQWRDWHDQTALGATTHVPGYGEVISTHYDPGLQEGQEAYARSQGWRAFLNEDGTTPRSATLTYAANPPNETGQFGKAGGLGELSALVGEAPVEIGNRVWID